MKARRFLAAFAVAKNGRLRRRLPRLARLADRVFPAVLAPLSDGRDDGC